ncbi:NAD-dependent epimerase/dehydratase family protein [Rhizobiaceae bacterium CRRU44]|uniref:NAD-dependent epimerase/dehydratase family protein n=1 Tax=Ferranicluibacter rubi TaxID=2715133 RepID=A0AA43ZLD2_9HYPH|nr:NAD-dependent epimerase/dehydratase family protein [Ferranicluibacter rubi]NHT79073.1 NAD-dependent epimerase/dehydratase family protein [Ferranicluibacter rubi]
MAGRAAVIIGGTGQIGRAVAQELIDKGWTVAVTHRGNRPLPRELTESGVTAIVYDRGHSERLRRLIRSGADVVIDTIAYDASHADELLEIENDVGSFVVISSSSVYCDDQGRSLDEGKVNGFPDLPDPMTEQQQTLPPGDQNYSTKKVALERRLLDRSVAPITVLRPCAIHGANSIHPREWWFVKRMIDGRTVIPLAYRGESRFHTTSVANIAGLTAIVSEKPAHRILNIGDERCLSVSEIGDLIRRRLQFPGHFALVDDDRYPPAIGATPWSVPSPFMIDSSAARQLGFKPLSYEDTIAHVCDWLIAFTADGRWKEKLPVFGQYDSDPFDYRAEDDFLASAGKYKLI